MKLKFTHHWSRFRSVSSQSILYINFFERWETSGRPTVGPWNLVLTINQNSKRLLNQALLRLRRVSNSFFKFSKRCLPMNFSLRRSKYTQLSQLASYSCQFNTGRVSRAILRLQNGIIFPCNYRKYCTKAGKIVVLCFTAKTSLRWAVCVTRVCCRRAAKCCII